MIKHSSITVWFWNRKRYLFVEKLLGRWSNLNLIYTQCDCIVPVLFWNRTLDMFAEKLTGRWSRLSSVPSARLQLTAMITTLNLIKSLCNSMVFNLVFVFRDRRWSRLSSVSSNSVWPDFNLPQ